MGVTWIGVCHDCKTFIDCNKCGSSTDMVRSALSQGSATHSDFSQWGDDIGYWGARLVWFMIKHGGHLTEMVSNCQDECFELQGRYDEECSPAEGKDR